MHILLLVPLVASLILLDSYLTAVGFRYYEKYAKKYTETESYELNPRFREEVEKGSLFKGKGLRKLVISLIIVVSILLLLWFMSELCGDCLSVHNILYNKINLETIAYISNNCGLNCVIPFSFLYDLATGFFLFPLLSVILIGISNIYIFKHYPGNVEGHIKMKSKLGTIRSNCIFFELIIILLLAYLLTLSTPLLGGILGLLGVLLMRKG